MGFFEFKSGGMLYFDFVDIDVDKLKVKVIVFEGVFILILFLDVVVVIINNDFVEDVGLMFDDVIV